MRQRGNGSRFALEAGAPIGIIGDVCGQNLHRDVAVQPRIACPKDLAHPAGPKEADDLVRPEGGAGSQRHCGHRLCHGCWPATRLSRFGASRPTSRQARASRVKGEISPGGGPKQRTDRTMVKLLRDVRYQGYVVLEHEAAEDPEATVPQYLQQLRKLIG